MRTKEQRSSYNSICFLDQTDIVIVLFIFNSWSTFSFGVKAYYTHIMGVVAIKVHGSHTVIPLARRLSLMQLVKPPL